MRVEKDMAHPATTLLPWMCLDVLLRYRPKRVPDSLFLFLANERIGSRFSLGQTPSSPPARL